jgi:hypothetical protein
MTTPESVNGIGQNPEAGQMPEMNASDGAGAEAAAVGASQRERSTIRFPYTDIRDAVQVATKLKGSYGSECDTDQLAAVMGQKPSSGSFRTKVATAATFGVIKSRRGSILLTDLGHEIVDERTRPSALLKAFLQVQLYGPIYEKFKGRSLPGDAGLESEMRTLGVLPSQADRARQAMMRSAEHAGLLWSGKDRLVLPPGAKMNGQTEPQPVGDPKDEGEKNLADSPVLQGLWSMLPKDGQFPPEKREQWFKALAINLDLVYGDGQITISRATKETDSESGIFTETEQMRQGS